MPSRARREEHGPAQDLSKFLPIPAFCRAVEIVSDLCCAGLLAADCWLQERRDGAMLGQAAASTGQVKSGRGRWGALVRPRSRPGTRH